MSLSSSAITGNTATSTSAARGGGIYNLGTLTVANCTISGNRASTGSSAGDGGGIYNGGTLTVTSSTVVGNTADHAGAGLANIGTTNLRNTTVSDNGKSGYSSFSGGGVANGGTMTLFDSTVTDNSANNEGGGIVSTATYAEREEHNHCHDSAPISRTSSERLVSQAIS